MTPNNHETYQYLLTLRTIAIQCGLLFIVGLCVMWQYNESVFDAVLRSVINRYASNGLLMTQLTETITLPLYISAMMSFATTLPIMTLLLWRFVKGALHQYERRLIGQTLIASMMFFYTGCTLCLFYVAPIMIDFFYSMTPSYVMMMPSAMGLAKFIIHLTQIFGLIALTPLIIVCLIGLNILSLAQLTKCRKHFIVMAFVIAMLLTPPDVISQVMVAIPLCLLFEVGIFVAKLHQKRLLKIKGYQD
ncbi:MAG: twin-arginine translocase subunit TatC [Candidatus Comchoanobacterales bacterium]